MKRFLVGKRISLHALSEADLAAEGPYFSWLDDLELDQFTGRSRFSNTRERMLAYYQKASRNDDLVLLGIYDNGSGRHIGNISLKDMDWENRRGWLGYLIGDRSMHRKGIATEAVLMFTYYAFRKLNLSRVYTTVSVPNVPSVRVLKKAGYIEEGRMRKHIILGDHHVDVLMFGALASEWLEAHAKIARDYFEAPPF